MNRDPWGDDLENGNVESLAAVGCLITATANGLGGLGIDKNPGELNADSGNFDNGDFSVPNVASDNELEYNSTRTGILKKLKTLKGSSTDYSIMADVWWKADNSKKGITHKLNVVDFFEGPTGPYVRVQGTSDNDYEARRRSSWIRDGDTILIPLPDVDQIRWMWRETQ